MKRILCALLLFASPFFAYAQKVDPEITVYKQMLSEREEQLAASVKSASEQIAALQQKIDDLTKQVALAKKDMPK